MAMKCLFEKYKNRIVELLNNQCIDKLLLKPLSEYFPTETIMKIDNSENKVKIFFEEFELIPNEEKYKDFISYTSEFSEWIQLFLEDSEEADNARLQFDITIKVLKIQNEDHIKSLDLDEKVLYNSRNIGLLNEVQLSDMTAYLNNHGLENAKIKFLLMISKNSSDWYGKLLYIYHSIKSNFIPDYLPEIFKVIETMSIEEEIKNYIIFAGNSIIQTNIDHDKNFSEINTSKIDTDFIKYDETQSLTPSISSSDNLFTSLMEINDSDIFSKSSTDNDDDNCTSIPDIIGQPDNNCTSIPDIIGQPDNNCTSIPDIIGQPDNNSQINPSTNTNGTKLCPDDDCSESSDGEEPVDDDLEILTKLFGPLMNKNLGEILNFNISTETKYDVGGTKELQMRNYQRELAEEGIKGKNVLICSPTGSGKTVVAVKIVEEHLTNNPNGKVAFLVHRIALVEQQYHQFSQYLKCKITRLSGSAKSSSTPLIGHLKSFDLFVLTSDILRNALEEDNETKLESINAFSLILFDECHNCDKKHPYNRIMTHYFKDKKNNKPVPQIIGLTASTGTNKAKTMNKAMKRLFTLCANLDTCIVSTVNDFKEELEKMQSKPTEEIITSPQRSSDSFDNELQKQMALCERMLQGMNARNFFPKDGNTQAIFNIPEDRLHQKYLGFVGKLHTELYNNTEEKLDGRKALFAISSYLNAFVRALMVNHLFGAKDAVKLIKDTLDLENDNPITCDVEKILRKNLKKLGTSDEQSENPCLRCLKDKIKSQIEEDNQSRIIVFVRERNYTQILKNIFSSESSAIKCDTVVGNTISAEQGGLTQNEMEEVLGKFRRGEINVLFSTTVAEEGLDIQKCNLVIRYGHVTNETAMVQSRGRARASNSKYIVIVPFKLEWQVNKENINKYRETMMYRAIAKFQQMEESEIKFEIDECQCERELQETCDKFGQQSISNRQGSTSTWNFNCKKCIQHICKSSDIRLAEGAHHIVINENCFESMVVSMVKNQNCCQIKCKKCSSVLGNRQSYKGRLFPTLKIDSFSLNCEGQSQSQSFKKWKDVPFKVSIITNSELINFNQKHVLAI